MKNNSALAAEIRRFKNVRLGLGGADPSGKAAKRMKKEYREHDAFLERVRNAEETPMPDWAIEDALYEGAKRASRGFRPLTTEYAEWPEAREAYLSCWK